MSQVIKQVVRASYGSVAMSGLSSADAGVRVVEIILAAIAVFRSVARFTRSSLAGSCETPAHDRRPRP